jgi:hypothetical protein
MNEAPYSRTRVARSMALREERRQRRAPRAMRERRNQRARASGIAPRRLAHLASVTPSPRQMYLMRRCSKWCEVVECPVPASSRLS